MATTYDLLATSTITGSANTITFSGIPQTYSDLVIKWRTRVADNQGYRSYAYWRTDDAWYHHRAFLFVVDSGTAFPQSNATFAAPLYLCGVTGAQDDTSGFFGTGELKITDYTSSYPKSAIWDSGHFSAQTTTWAQGVGSTQLLSARPITSITLNTNVGAGNLTVGSMASLYGLKSS
jgi:hypothetical protein